MNRDLDMLTVLLLDPCLTTDEATREAAAISRLAGPSDPTRTRREPKPERPAPKAEDVGF